MHAVGHVASCSAMGYVATAHAWAGTKAGVLRSSGTACQGSPHVAHHQRQRQCKARGEGELKGLVHLLGLKWQRRRRGGGKRPRTAAGGGVCQRLCCRHSTTHRHRGEQPQEQQAPGPGPRRRATRHLPHAPGQAPEGVLWCAGCRGSGWAARFFLQAPCLRGGRPWAVPDWPSLLSGQALIAVLGILDVR